MPASSAGGSPLQPPPVPLGQPSAASDNRGGVGSPLLTPEPTRAMPAEPPAGGGRVAWVGAVVAAVALLFGGGWFALSAFGAAGGAESPEAAVDQMLAAIGDEDFIALGELLDPTERRTMAEPMLTEVLPELQRLGLIDESFDEGSVEGIDIEFVAPAYRIETVPLTADFVHVFFDSGESTTTFTPAEVPFGDLIRDRFGDEIDAAEIDTESSSMESDNDTPVVLVERDGRWYFSLWYSVAETVRIDAGESVPAIEEMPVRLGADSPEAAVDGMLAAVSDLDLAGMIGRLDPNEMSALYRYSPLFLDEAQVELDAFVAEMSEDGVFWEITDVESVVVSQDGDKAIVEITSLTLTINADGVEIRITYGKQEMSVAANVDAGGLYIEGQASLSPRSVEVSGQIDGQRADLRIDWSNEGSISLSGRVDGEQIDGTIVFGDVCSQFEITVSGETESGCLEDNLNLGPGELSLLDTYRRAIEEMPEEFPGIPMTAREVDGAWYIAPITTGMDGFVSWLETLERDSVEQWLNDFDSYESFSNGDEVVEFSVVTES